MGELERKRCERLGINFLIVLVFFVQTFMVAGISFSQSFLQGKYPLAHILDSYLFVSLSTSPVLISSLVKKVIEIEGKNKMRQMQIILGERVNSILLGKFKGLSFRLPLLQVIETLVFLVLARRSDYFHMTGGLTLRLGPVNLSVLMVSLFFSDFSMIVEMKVKRVYTLSFLSIVRGLTGIISVLTSEILAYINPSAWMANLMNFSYVREGNRFVQILGPLNFHILIIALVLLTTGLAYLRTMKFYRLWKD